MLIFIIIIIIIVIVVVIIIIIIIISDGCGGRYILYFIIELNITDLIKKSKYHQWNIK